VYRSRGKQRQQHRCKCCGKERTAVNEITHGERS
jgi:hypothetical protein